MRTNEFKMTGKKSYVRKFEYHNKTCMIKLMPHEMNDEKNVLKEMKIHKNLIHDNIIRYITDLSDEKSYGIVLEYGDYTLRSMIETGIGIDTSVAHMFFRQLISGIKYLHNHGICHRDIKPENILITKEGNVKICDFGDATLYFYKERRKLKKIAGSYKFMAPEVLKGEYDGCSSDIWSCGITLYNMITGNFPWRVATEKDEEYLKYRRDGPMNFRGFSNMRKSLVDLLVGMLEEENNRFTLKDIEKNTWFSQKNDLMDNSGKCVNSSFLERMKQIVSDLNYTQPDEIGRKKCYIPASLPLQSNGQNNIYNMYFDQEPFFVIKVIKNALTDMNVFFNESGDSFVFSTVDTKKNKLNGEIIVQKIANKLRVTFKRTNGDLIEFKKFVNFIKTNFFNQ